MRTDALHDICHLCTFTISSRNIPTLGNSSLSPSRVVKAGNSNYFNNIVDSFSVGQGPKDGIYLIFLSEKLLSTFSVK